ncbi:hypothetical protein MCBMB27_02651 [Methylobacterium phyllosphaerae]|uniref:Uncharacterized protein n=1 Tax=Methylobacterium phyllosphaerae TaxID=418223 RepID=A0AAE8L6Y6_9HYPH|nr:hypothetical protein [Methylobacterium phyllosphaerae]APT31942.1 hypothetical protein MCBMB27_02651 [Methylobacterium phyllosphaerae]SFH01166.1 hypothetical protein SAMN05192567_11216 [Methylobacterium phyllosphaerae]
MMALLFILRVAAALTVLGVSGLLGLWVGPDLEAVVAPVLRDQRVDHVDRFDGGARACWTWRLGKVRTAEAVDAGWTIRAGDRIYPYQRVVRVADSFEDGNALVARPVRPGQWTRKCIDVPPDLWGRPFRITGFVEYRTALTGALWTVRQPAAEVSVP